MKKTAWLCAVLLSVFQYAGAQTGKAALYAQINKEIWDPFIKAFDTSDPVLFMSIHSKELIRVGGDGRIRDYQSYKASNERNFNRAKENGSPFVIDFRFLERAVSDSAASERGIYKFTANKGKPGEQDHYGKFHVILRKEEGAWKILVDYDSDENNTIGAASFNAGYLMTDFEKFGRRPEGR